MALLGDGQKDAGTEGQLPSKYVGRNPDINTNTESF